MNASESADAHIPTSPMVDVKTPGDIPLRDGFVTFNTGHSGQMLIDYSQITQSRIVTQYQIKTGEDSGIYLSIDFVGLLNTNELLSNEQFMRTLMNQSYAQIANDIQAAVTSRDVLDIGDTQKQRYLRSRATFLSHSKTLNGFFNKLTKGKVDMTRYQPQITGIKDLFKWKTKLPELT